MAKAVKPFLKWAGGKRWFVQNHGAFLPRKFNRYIEPFLGSGAVFFHLRPESPILGDSNLNLINTYKALKENWKKVYNYLLEHHNNHSEDHYYAVRSLIPENFYEQAARIIYLNRTCWNGLYRVNQKGIFNVPIGSKSSVLFDDDDFEIVSLSLKNAQLLNKDFEYLINQAQEGDLIFADPPYTVRHNHNGFVKYNERIFSWADQQRLYYSLERARKRGAYVVCTNACHSSVRELYQSNFEIVTVARNSPISSKASTRKKFDELVILSR